MCRLLAISSRTAPPAAILESFRSLAVEGNTPGLGPDPRGHQDGWGLAAFLGDRLIHERSARSAADPRGGWDDAIHRLLRPDL
jgi:predicted glutamine amidotransferase